MANDFASMVNKWCQQSEARLKLVWKLSVQDVVAYMQMSVEDGGHMPVRSGELRDSLRATSSMGGAAPVARSGKGTDLSSFASLSLNTVSGGSIGFFYKAPHGLRMNYGFHGVDSLGRHYDQKGYLFVEFAAQRWPTIVRKNAAAVKKAGTL